MTKKFFSWAVLLFMMFELTAAAQDKTSQGEFRPHHQTSLEGIWQLCSFQTSDSGKLALHLAPVLKILSNDGHYQTVFIKTTTGGCVITNQGTYQKQTDSTYIETPLHPLDAETGIQQTVTYHLKGTQWMVIDFKTSQSTKIKHEIWMRLRFKPNGKTLIEQPEKGQESISTDEFPQQMRQSKRRNREQISDIPDRRINQQTTTTEKHSWIDDE